MMLFKIDLAFACRGLAFAFGIMSVPTLLAGGDSSSMPRSFHVPKRGETSLLGTASDGMFCTYRESDGRIHCQESADGSTEYLVSRLMIPLFRGTRQSTEGQVQVRVGETYGFVSAIAETPDSQGPGAIQCKLALELVLGNGSSLWIWYDELRSFSGVQGAAIDSNGDGMADLALTGSWSGKINGTRRWWDSDPYNTGYSDDERSFPDRPEFGTVNGISRGCRQTGARVAVLVELTTTPEGHLTNSMRSLLGISD